jgi:hypothetical protein
MQGEDEGEAIKREGQRHKVKERIRGVEGSRVQGIKSRTSNVEVRITKYSFSNKRPETINHKPETNSGKGAEARKSKVQRHRGTKAQSEM